MAGVVEMLLILQIKIRFPRSNDRSHYIIAIRLVARPHKVLLRASRGLLAKRSSPVHQMLKQRIRLIQDWEKRSRRCDGFLYSKLFLLVFGLWAAFEQPVNFIG